MSGEVIVKIKTDASSTFQGPGGVHAPNCPLLSSDGDSALGFNGEMTLFGERSQLLRLTSS